MNILKKREGVKFEKGFGWSDESNLRYGLINHKWNMQAQGVAYKTAPAPHPDRVNLHLY